MKIGIPKDNGHIVETLVACMLVFVRQSHILFKPMIFTQISNTPLGGSKK
jgi:hypothetical protein